MSAPCRVALVVGARPNFAKIAPIYRQMGRLDGAFERLLVHTGQHYDHRMSGVFLEELGLGEPDLELGVGSGSHAEQTARVLSAFDAVLAERRPDLVLVAGDVNSSLACALAAAKRCIPVGHVEAGLRSFDRTMPEEVNRVLIDHLSELLFTPSRDADRNLATEGRPRAAVRFVGNVMIDTLVALRPRAAERAPALLDELGVERFGLVTLHRPSNVDRGPRLEAVLAQLSRIARDLPLVFPIHPRTRKRLRELGLEGAAAPLRLVEPLAYLDFLALMERAALVVTDSGGVQEETTFLGVPCLTLRPNTERPVTLAQGTNRLVTEVDALAAAAAESLARPPSPASPPELWDGRAAVRIVEAIHQWTELGTPGQEL